ncbi:MAG TPA: macro domain-containing protein, partial [Methylomirabilota bacterium]|nr:macro domain-containing protein [Methylomirabilota bacterium]
NCYRNSLALAASHQLESLAFPSISTGAYGFPFERAAEIALRTAADFLARHLLPKKIIFVCFQRHDSDIYSALLRTFSDL